MALKFKNEKNFELRMPDKREVGENVVLIKGGSTVVNDQWVYYNDIKINIKDLVDKYVSTTRRLFNNFGDFLYVLIVRDKTGKIEVIPNISFNKKSYGDIKVFPNLSDKAPLILVKLQQDGSSGLTGMMPITRNDIEVYKGYGNFTLYGPKGSVGDQGDTGFVGITGMQGVQGTEGSGGDRGITGIEGYSIQGETGIDGLPGLSCYRYIPDRY